MQYKQSSILTINGERPVIWLHPFDDEHMVTIDFTEKLTSGISCPHVVGMTPEYAEDMAATLMEAARLAREATNGDNV